MSAKDGGLRAIFRARVVRAHWVSVETPLTGSGVPDANFCIDGAEGWMEFKRSEGWSVPLRPEQVGWILRRCRAGGRVVVGVRRWIKRKTTAADELWLCAGSAAKELKEFGLPRDGVVDRYWPPGTLLGKWSGGPSRWNWDEVSDALLR